MPVFNPTLQRRPQQQAPVAQQPQMPTDFEGHTQYILGGNMLEGNPYLQSGVLDPARREADRTYADARANLDAAAEGGGVGAFGGDIYQTMDARRFSEHQQNLGNFQNQMLYQNYGDERSNQMQALSGLGQYETAEANREAQIQSQQLMASLERDLQSGQLDFNRQQLALQAMNSLAQNDLNQAQFLAGLAGQQFNQDFSMMQLGGQMGMGWGDQQLDAFGMVPGMEGAGYTGYQNAFGAEQTVNQQDAQAAAQRAQIEAQNAMSQWQYGRYNPDESFQNYLNQLGQISGPYGTSYTEGEAAPQTIPGQQNPWPGAIAQGVTGFGAAGGFNLPWFGGGGGNGGAADPGNSAWLNAF